MVQEKTIPQESRLGPKRHRFSNAEFLRMLEAGFFDQPPRVELINGEILEVDAVGPKHAFAVASLVERLNLLISEVFVWPQCPLQIPQESTPLPDIVLLQLPKDQYKEQLPQPNQALLVIEVADSSLATDRNDKLPLYAKAGIAEYWIVNLQDNQLEVYRDPKGSDYLTRTTLQPGTPAQALCLNGAIQWG
jgi:Uma2 family endonuclease